MFQAKLVLLIFINVECNLYDKTLKYVSLIQLSGFPFADKTVVTIYTFLLKLSSKITHRM